MTKHGAALPATVHRMRVCIGQLPGATAAMQAPAHLSAIGQTPARRAANVGRPEPIPCVPRTTSTTPHGDLRPTRGERNVIHARYAK